MSKRHQSSRRRAYGRRQHELHERQERRPERTRPEAEWGLGSDDAVVDPLAFLDPRAPRLRYGFGD